MVFASTSRINTMVCDICGYNGLVDKSDSKYLMLFDFKMKEQIPEQTITSLGEFCFCSKCRKDLFMFINAKRTEHKLLPIMQYEHVTFLETWKAMSNEKKAYIYRHVNDAKMNGFASSPTGKANMERLHKSLIEDLTDDETLLLGYCRNIQDLPESIKRYEKEKNQDAKESS